MSFKNNLVKKLASALPSIIKKNNRGFTLVEIMIAAAMLGGLSLALMQLNKGSLQTQADSVSMADYVQLQKEISFIISDGNSCSASIGATLGPPIVTGVTFNGSTIKNTPITGLELWSSNQAAPPVRSRKRFYETQKFGKVVIGSISFSMPDYNAGVNFPVGTQSFKGELKTSGSKLNLGKTKTFPDIIQSINVTFDTDAAGLSTIKSCSLSNLISNSSRIATFLTPGTYTLNLPENTGVLIEIWGAGGGGGGGAGTQPTRGGGGGGGGGNGQHFKIIKTGLVGNYNIKIGNGGSSGNGGVIATDGMSGNAGEDSTFEGTLIVARGGGGGFGGKLQLNGFSSGGVGGMGSSKWIDGVTVTDWRLGKGQDGQWGATISGGDGGAGASGIPGGKGAIDHGAGYTTDGSEGNLGNLGQGGGGGGGGLYTSYPSGGGRGGGGGKGGHGGIVVIW